MRPKASSYVSLALEVTAYLISLQSQTIGFSLLPCIIALTSSWGNWETPFLSTWYRERSPGVDCHGGYAPAWWYSRKSSINMTRILASSSRLSNVFVSTLASIFPPWEAECPGTSSAWHISRARLLDDSVPGLVASNQSNQIMSLMSFTEALSSDGMRASEDGTAFVLVLLPRTWCQLFVAIL